MIRSAPPRAVRGVTLIELMVTMIVAAILLAIAVPSFRHIMGSTNLGGVSSDPTSDVAFARTEAVMRRVKVAVASSAGGWASGWVVQIPSSSTSGTPPPPVVLRRHAPIPKTYTLNAGSGGTAIALLTYKTDGTLDTLSNNACFTIKAPNDTKNVPQYLGVTLAGTLQQASGSTAPSGWTCP